VKCVTQVAEPASDGHCIWYGECPKDNHKLNCYYNGPAKPLSASAADILIELCPMLNIGPGKCSLLVQASSSVLTCNIH